ncbi:MAG: tetratricopeptide repeat protein [Chloroflexota bacterium]|nr:tetratricopeptide repeat protein [Chloroflexota bacterium]
MSKSGSQPSARLRLVEARKRQGWSQQEMADHLGTTRLNVSRWERGITTPSPYFRIKLTALLKMNAHDLLQTETESEQTSQEETLPPDQALSAPGRRISSGAWTIPYPRNAFFTGREDLLHELHARLGRDHNLALTQAQALSGLGGIGKTQTAIEYAYRYRTHYQAVLWVRAETQETLSADFMSMATVLHLQNIDERDPQRTIEAVTCWFRDHSGWLLILDNVEELSLLRRFLPLEPAGHLLFTTRLQATGSLAQHLDLAQMELDEGVLFLLRRAGLITRETPLSTISDERRALASSITRLMGGLPLALDQAGAYIEETGCSLAAYRDHYRNQQALLLDRRGEGNLDHPHSVGATLSLTFEQVTRTNPAALDLLHLCAFLHPDAIPEEILTKGAPDLEPALQVIVRDPMQFDAAIQELRRYSLVRRNPNLQALTIHRVVQAVIKGRMDEHTQRQWAERVVRIVNRTFPDLTGAFTWECNALYLPQAQQCVFLIGKWDIVSIEAGQLLNRLGIVYFTRYGYYAQAEEPFTMALAIRQRLLEAEHSEVTESLNNLAALYQARGDYVRAEPLYRQVLAIRERSLSHEHPLMAKILSNLALLHRDLGKWGEAGQFFQRALVIQERVLEPDHPETTTTRVGLGVLYGMQGRYSQAEELLQRARASAEKTLGEGHPTVGVYLNNLAKLHSLQGDYVQAEALYQQALTIYERAFGNEHPNIATTLGNIAQLAVYQGQYQRAEGLYQQAVGIREQVLGQAHPRTALMLRDLAMLYAKQERYEQAESLYQRALSTLEQASGPEHPDVASSLTGLANLYREQHKYEQAKSLYQRALSIRELTQPHHPDFAALLYDVAVFQQTQGNYQAATDLYQRALAIQKQALPVQHLATVATEKAYAGVLHFMATLDDRALINVVPSRRDEGQRSDESTG